MARPEARFFHHVDPEKVFDHVLSALTQANNVLINSGIKSAIDPTEGAQGARNVAGYHNALHESLGVELDNTLSVKYFSISGLSAEEIDIRLKELESNFKKRTYKALEETRQKLPKPFQGNHLSHQDPDQSSI